MTSGIGPGRGGADDAAGNHPVRVHDGRAFLLRDAKRLEPSGKNRQRSDGYRRCAQPDIGAHPFGIAERVQRLHRRVVEEMEVDAAIELRPVPFRMPRRHQMHLVPARGDALSDRFHEAADRITREPRIRRRDHDDALAHWATMRTYHSLKACVRSQLQALTARSERCPAGMVTSILSDALGIPPEHQIFEVSPVERDVHDLLMRAAEGSTGSTRSVSPYDRDSGRKILSVAPGCWRQTAS